MERSTLLLHLRLLGPQSLFASVEFGDEFVLLRAHRFEALSLGLEALPFLVDGLLSLLDFGFKSRPISEFAIHLLATLDEFRFLRLNLLDLGQKLFAIFPQPIPLFRDFGLLLLELLLAVQ